MKKTLLTAGAILCFITCVVLFVIQVVFISLTSLRLSLKENVLQDALKTLDIGKTIDTLKNGYGMQGTNDSSGASTNEQESLILNSKAFQNFIIKKIERNLLTGKDTEITESEISNLIKDIKEELGDDFEISPSELDELRNYLLDNKSSGLNVELEKVIANQTGFLSDVSSALGAESEIDEILGSFNISGEAKEKILNSKTVKSFIEEQIKSGKTTIDETEINALMKDLEKEMGTNSSVDFSILNELKDSYFSTQSDSFSSEKEETSNSEQTSSSIDESSSTQSLTNLSIFDGLGFDKSTLNMISNIMKYGVNIFFVVISIIIYSIMCLLRWSFYKPLLWYGITTVFSSIAMIASVFMLNQTLITGNKNLSDYSRVLVPIFDKFKNKTTSTCIGLLVIGIIMIVGYVILNNKMEEKDSETL